MPQIPMRRRGEPEDFAGIAACLKSVSSLYDTGDSNVVDGAYTLF